MENIVDKVRVDLLNLATAYAEAEVENVTLSLVSDFKHALLIILPDQIRFKDLRQSEELTAELVELIKNNTIGEDCDDSDSDSDSDDVDSNDVDSDDGDSNDVDSNDGDSNDRDSDDRDSNNRDSDDRDSDNGDSDDGDSDNGDSNDVDSDDRDSDDGDSDDGDSNDGDSDDGDSDDRDSNDRDSDDGDSNNGDSNNGDSDQDVDSAEWDSYQDWNQKANELVANDGSHLLIEDLNFGRDNRRIIDDLCEVSTKQGRSVVLHLDHYLQMQKEYVDQQAINDGSDELEQDVLAIEAENRQNTEIGM